MPSSHAISTTNHSWCTHSSLSLSPRTIQQSLLSISFLSYYSSSCLFLSAVSPPLVCSSLLFWYLQPYLQKYKVTLTSYLCSPHCLHFINLLRDLIPLCLYIPICICEFLWVETICWKSKDCAHSWIADVPPIHIVIEYFPHVSTKEFIPDTCVIVQSFIHVYHYTLPWQWDLLVNN